MKGCFIAFEGANGVGKSTIINHICNKLLQDNFDVALTKEPSTSEIGTFCRKAQNNVRGKTLACLAASDRFFHVENEIVPQIDEGKIVLCDRNILSAYTFNKMDDISFEYTERLYEGIRYPDIIILFYANPEEIYARLLQRETLTRYESATIGLEQKIIEESAKYLNKKGTQIFEVSTEKSVEETVKETYHIIKEYISKRDREDCPKTPEGQ